MKVGVTYHGPSGCYSGEYEGEWFTLERGKETLIPEPLAESLLDVQGHNFAIGDEAEVIENDQGTERTVVLTSGSGSGSGDDPDWVNADPTYGGGS